MANLKINEVFEASIVGDLPTTGLSVWQKASVADVKYEWNGSAWIPGWGAPIRLDWLPSESDGDYTIQMGGRDYVHNYTPGFDIASADYWRANTFIGANSGNFTMTNNTGFEGTYNTGVGSETLASLTTGFSNLAFGNEALALLTTGRQNVAIGGGAMYYSTTALDNMAIGAGALQHTIDGNANTAIGTNAGRWFGGNVSNEITSGTNNIYIGGGTFGSSANPTNEIAIGHNVQASGDNTVTLGNTNITKIIAGADYTAVDDRDLVTKGYADANYGAGDGTIGGTITTTQIAYGAATADSIEGDARFTYDPVTNIASIDDIISDRVISTRYGVIGKTATDAYFDNAIFMDYGAGGSDIFLHTASPAGVTAGFQNIFLGQGAASTLNMTGVNGSNVGIGNYSQYELTSGTFNVSVGQQSLQDVTTGTWNVAVGHNAGFGMAAGSNNVALGGNAFANLAGGSNNIAIGRNAGHNTPPNVAVTDLTSSVYIGSQSDPSAATGIVNEIAIGVGSQGSGSNTATIGSPGITAIKAGADYTAVDDRDLVTKGFADATYAGGAETDPVFVAAEPNLAKLDAGNSFTGANLFVTPYTTFGNPAIPTAGISFNLSLATGTNNIALTENVMDIIFRSNTYLTADHLNTQVKTSLDPSTGDGIGNRDYNDGRYLSNATALVNTNFFLDRYDGDWSDGGTGVTEGVDEKTFTTKIGLFQLDLTGVDLVADAYYVANIHVSAYTAGAIGVSIGVGEISTEYVQASGWHKILVKAGTGSSIMNWTFPSAFSGVIDHVSIVQVSSPIRDSFISAGTSIQPATENFEQGKLYRLTSASPIIVTIPNTLTVPEGGFIRIRREGTGSVTIDPTGGATINGVTTDYVVSGQWDEVVLTSLGDNTDTYSLTKVQATNGIANIVEDTTPQLGGLLDVQSNSIYSSGGSTISVGNGRSTTGVVGTGYIEFFSNSVKIGSWDAASTRGQVEISYDDFGGLDMLFNDIANSNTSTISYFGIGDGFVIKDAANWNFDGTIVSGLALSTTAIAASDTVDASFIGDTIFMTAAGATTITIPDSLAQGAGSTFTIVAEAAGNVTVTTTGTATINGSTSFDVVISGVSANKINSVQFIQRTASSDDWIAVGDY